MALYALRELVLARGGRRVLEVPALDIAADAVTALLGPNGAGKSTLLEALAGLLLPQSGSLCFEGMAVTARHAPLLVRRVGYVAQQPYLFDRSVRANVALGLRLRGTARAAALRAADAMLERLGIGALAGRSARELSGGEGQKVALARALVLAPEVLLLDEPFSALDAAASADLRSLLAGFRTLGARAVVFATHDETLALDLADATLRLERGQVADRVRHNLFPGVLDSSAHVFRIGAVEVHVAAPVQAGSRIAIEPAQIMLTGARPASGPRNALQGRVVALTEQGDEVLVTVAAGLRLQVLVTHEGVSALGLVPGRPVWANFDASAVRVE